MDERAHAPEIALLLIASRLQLEKPAASLLAEFADGIDWTLLVGTAVEHGVAGLLCHSLLKMPATLVPQEIAHACRQHLQQTGASNRQAADQLCAILGELGASGIAAIPFKGPALAMTAYDSLELRAFRDLDFLIRPEHARRCLERLAELGYRQDSPLSPRQARACHRYGGQEILFGRGMPLEPHWAFAPDTLAFGLDYPGFWRRALQKPFNGRRVACFAPEDELVILCIHGAKEKWSQLKWVADVAEFVRHHPDLDWQTAIDRAQAQGVARMTKLGLGLAGQLLGAPLPSTVERWIAADTVALDWIKALAEGFFESRKETDRSVYTLSSFHWRMRERPLDRWRYLYRTVTQPRLQHFQSVALPDRLFFLYVPYKILHDYLMLPAWLFFKRLSAR